MTEDVFANYLYYTYPKSGQIYKSPIGILVGDEGTGKTTVFNLLTNNYSQPSSNSETTKTLFFSSPSRYGERFQILDTPGVGADYEDDKLTLEHLLRQVLLEGPLSRIFFVMKYERFGPMVKKLGEQLMHLEPYKNLLTIVVTCWDREDTAENRQVFETAKKKMLDYDNELPNSFIFLGKDASGESACQAFYNCLCIGQPNNLESLTGQPLQGCPHENKGILLNKYTNAFAEMHRSLQTQLLSEKTKDIEAFGQPCINRISQKAEDILCEFAKDHGSDMTELDCYGYFMQLKAQFMPMIENIRQLELAKEEHSPTQSMRDPREMFRACPHCHLIWAKVQESDGEMQCMKRLESKVNLGHQLKDQLIPTRHPNDNNVSWWRKFFNWIKNCCCLGRTHEETQIDQYQNTSQLTHTSNGCGRSFNWADQPTVSQETYDRFKAAGFIGYLERCQEEQLLNGAINIHEIESRVMMYHGIQ